MTTELTTKSQKYNFCNEAVDLKKKIELNFLTLGAMLSRIRSEMLWEAGWSSQDEYEMELKMSPATVSRLIRIYEIFHLKYGIPQKKLAEAGGYTVIAEYLPMVTEKTTKEEVQDWLGEAASLARADIRRTIVEKRKGVDMAKCKHENGYQIFVCPDCGERNRI